VEDESFNRKVSQKGIMFELNLEDRPPRVMSGKLPNKIAEPKYQNINESG
jgi:hypothetical protein